MLLDQILDRCPPTSRPTLDDAARGYLKQWVELDVRPRTGMDARNPRDVQLDALTYLVGRYRVARNLPRRFDVDRGMARYEPLLDAVEECRTATSGTGDAVRIVSDLADRVSSRYGGTRAVSLASKVGWFAFGSPVVIYDSLARDALGVRDPGYEPFFEVWRRSYVANHDAIRIATQGISDDEWFRERVFDIFLWKVGDVRRRIRARQGEPN